MVDFIDNNVELYTSSIVAPTIGTWTKGDRIIVITPNSLGIKGFYCSSSGTPGSWVTLT